jgi:hypothetical protein
MVLSGRHEMKMRRFRAQLPEDFIFGVGNSDSQIKDIIAMRAVPID